MRILQTISIVACVVAWHTIATGQQPPAPGGAPTLEQIFEDQIFGYEYASDADRVGKLIVIP